MQDDAPVPTLESITAAFEAVSFEQLLHHFTTCHEPFVVLSGVSVDLFNAYFEDDEEAPFRLRFVDLVDGDVIITDVASCAHETVIGNFEYAFLQATGDGDEVNSSGSFTASRGQGIKMMQADATYGPFYNTLNRGPPPTLDEGPPRVLRRCSEWVTLAVVVGHYQTWTGLEAAGNWWSHYVGVKYVLLMKVNENASTLAYKLFEISQVGDLPLPSQQGSLTVDDDMKQYILRIDTRHLLAIPHGDEIPSGMHDVCAVDLGRVLRQAHRSCHN
ncbi:hypothetical protein SDRG_07589 [Saprolegnia diclina VS20]|uniref:Uncharacterized protein n=1 Tax=Saprolegnia diclina (strain VS20) TaxID=1156394 RepID=T0RWP5_SAPDV|nr:hypothetical protein SDRG_07589 [Saprolegnia diclina VS20]EQC34782.1 hypothetical protein SDRG_07589 [Saprolegnia diclina VS20]|eukprot:XP_008611654.1 hypothetical protein SDRG_07589 [Saprolegnia diclina VS20]